MKNKAKALAIVSALLIAFVSLTGCGKSKKDPIVGQWKNDTTIPGYEFIYTFNEDGTCSYEAAGVLMKCTYKINGDKISILYDGDTESFDTTYSIDGNKLNVVDSFGEDTIYIRK